MGRKKLNKPRINKKLTYDECKFVECLLVEKQIDLLRSYSNKKINYKDFNAFMDIIFTISFRLSLMYSDIPDKEGS